MAKLLYRLHNAPEDEVADIITLLEDNEVEYYQTHAGRWFLGIAALWVHTQEQYDRARPLIEAYCQQRNSLFSEERQRLDNLSFAQGLFERLRQDPKGFVVNLLAIAMVLFISFSLTVLPFLG